MSRVISPVDAPPAPARPPAAMARRYDRQRAWVERRHMLCVAPLMIYLALFYLYPVGAMLFRSVEGQEAPTLAHYLRLFESPAYARIFFQTVELALVTTALCLALGYPLAYAMAMARPARAAAMLALVLAPFWTSVLVRSYAWMVLLGRDGIVNQLLMDAGLATEPAKLLYTRFAVYLAMVHIMLPFMVLPLYSVLKGLDRNLIRAADGLGASPRRIFRHVVAPLSLPGVAAGCLLVFILALGFYITPALVGGPKDMTISTLIGQQLDMYDWNFAAALAAVLLAFSLVCFAVFDRAVGMDKLFRSEK